MASGGKVAAAGIVATTMMVGGRELVELAPSLASRTARIAERSSIKLHPHTFRSSNEYSTELIIAEYKSANNLKFTKSPTAEYSNFASKPAHMIIQTNPNWKADAINSYFSEAEPNIINSLSKLTRPVSISKADSVIRGEITSTIQTTIEKNKTSNVHFEVLTGKLKIDSSAVFVGVQVSGGEINIYKVTLTMASAVAACNGVIVADFEPCLKLAVSKAKKLVEIEITDGSKSQVEAK